ncbi:pseudouridine synthase [Taibaiella koreensis]|uniref:pseudouridine synthase n=1 Tax=Taibaiella koreensis TaxID=1268548 RepID=UPI000E59CAF3|nr:pseudouridine synthase [Taibaiella koreensis]
MHKKPFHSDSRSDRESSGSKEERPFRKSFDNKEERPFKKTFGDKGERPFKKSFGDKEERPFKKSFGDKDERPFKKSFGDKDERPFKKSFGDKDERPFKKSFDDKEERPFKKSFGDKDERPFKKPFGNKEERPFKKSFGDKNERPFKKSFGNKEERPFKKAFGDKEERPFKKSFGNKEERPFKKSFGDKEERPFKKSFGNKEERPFKKSFGDKEERPFKKSFGDKEERPFKKSFGDKDERPFKKPFKQDGERSFSKGPGKEDRPFKKTDRPDKKQAHRDEEEPKRPNRYANAFGKLDDEELAARQHKQKLQRERKEQEEEVTFSKELDNKWDNEPQERSFGKSDVKPGRKKTDDGEEPPRRNRHDAQSRFKKQFDNENPHERAYNARPDSREAAIEQPAQAGDDQPMPLNKFIAHCDICSRRDAVALIKEGKVMVNDTLITEPGFKVTTADTVLLNGNKLVIQKNLIYILMNKPKGFITTTDDPKGRRTVMEMVENLIEERVFPVGRLDRNTTGLLLLTNDGELTQKLAHPKYGIKKVYKATLDKNLTKADFDKIKEGLMLEDGQAEVDQLEYLDSKNEIGLEIHSGKNRIVRRIFESLGYEVEKLDRVMYAGLTKKNVLRGKWRFLTKQEVINLKHLH